MKPILHKAYAVLGASMLAVSVLLTASCSEAFVQDPVDLVNPLMGTASDFRLSTGNTYPAIALPWGMNFWTPQTGTKGDGWQYTYGAHTIAGFKQTHQPSPWINDYGCFSVMPVRLQEGQTPEMMLAEDARRSFFSHQSETALPYFYRVYLADHDVSVEITPTERAAVMRLTFPESNASGFVIDSYGGELQIVDNRTIIGSTSYNHGGVPEDFRNWFIIRSDKAFVLTASEEGHTAIVGFSTRRGEQVNLRMASSFISASQAEANLQEAGGSFDEVKSAAKARWNEVLGRIAIAGGTPEQQKTFYSCLYRCTLFPRKFYEISGGRQVHYSPYDGLVHDGPLYTDTGFWDTFRALLPLTNLVYPEVGREIVQGLANIARENDFLPEWASPGHRDCMVGNNSASVVAGAALAGLVSDEDLQVLYKALVYGTEHSHPGIESSGRYGHEYYNSLGYIPCDVGINESVARTLEYAYDDWCIARIATLLGRPQEEIALYEGRSGNWRNVFDPGMNLMRGKKADGSFEEPFSPYKWGGAFTEGNSWHYTWSVFHDVPGLVAAMGGKENFEKMLDSVFVVPPVYDDSYYGYRIHEITEMQVADMGNYAHGNQPAQHLVYLYDCIGERDKAAARAREVMDRLYKPVPDGYCGDEDNGQTSAWYVFSAMGYYPVNPASGEFAKGAPLFSRVEVRK